MEARRIYKAVEVGVSAWVRKEGGRYVDWKFHPENIYAVCYSYHLPFLYYLA